MIDLIELNPDISRKEREKLFKKQEILNAAVKLFSENGFENTKLDDIAEVAEFGKGTIYNYFNSKEDIYIALIEYILTKFNLLVLHTYENTDSFYDFLDQLLESLFEIHKNNANHFVVVMRTRYQSFKHLSEDHKKIVNSFQEKVMGIYKKRIIESIKSGEIREIDSTSMSFFIMGIFMQYIMSLVHCENLKEMDPEKEKQFLLDIIFKGLKANN